MVVEEACGWVGRGHTTRIGLHQVPICGQRDAIGGEKGGKEHRLGASDGGCSNRDGNTGDGVVVALEMVFGGGSGGMMIVVVVVATSKIICGAVVTTMVLITIVIVVIVAAQKENVRA
uniref:Uncharacterized protein n=1 Tax=Fagus sylvatica TaxID=28930 RepID=A0A2N9I4M1_FAGSY